MTFNAQCAVLCTVLAAAAQAASVAAWPTDPPFWPHYSANRNLQVLDGEWDFGYIGAVDPVNISPDDCVTPNTTNVPNSYDVSPPGTPGVRGTACYKTKFDLAPNAPGLVYFAGCSFYCNVFIDGKSVGEHRAGGYQPFWLSIPASSASSREMLVVVNNEFNSTTAPTHTGGDFYFFGGITRHVLVHEVPKDTYIHQVETFPLSITDGTIKIRVVLGGPASTGNVKLSLKFDGTEVSDSSYPVVGNVVTISQIAVPNFKIWSLTKPQLHTLTVTASNDDAVQVRFGIREIGTSGGRFTLNGEVVKLHGINRHTMWPDTGSALRIDQVKTDVGLLKELNANYVRGAHYPQPQEFLDLCDEQGIAIWEETLGPGVSLKNLQDPYWMKYQLQAVNEMIDASVNHPSIIFHGFYNEGPSNEADACPGYNTSASAIRSRVGNGNPPSRLITWASDKKTSDKCLDIADVVSFNSYPAWYQDAGKVDTIVPFWKGQADWVRANYPTKPFTISETGAGGVYEWTDNSTDTRWGQNYQAEVVALDAKFAMECTNVSGITVWQFNDIKVDTTCAQCNYEPHPANLSIPWTCASIDVTCNRPGGENHKGQVDFWRRKKKSFSVLQIIYSEDP